MPDLEPVPFPVLLRRMRDELAKRQAIFDLPVKKWHVPDAGLDLSARHFGRPVSTPVGPAAGPHTQLAQNIVLAWLAGSRILELKTVQINDRLEIPRPCIQVPNVGFNVEWSQELLVEQSQKEYAKAVYLIEILKSTRGFGVFPGDHGFDTVFDISVGYDLEGIRSAKVTGFLEAMKHPEPLYEELRRELDGDLAAYRDLELPRSISDCVTLSTFHGCPAGEIESISRYLLEERGLHTIIKLNPTLLGFDEVREILVDKLGYEHLELSREAFDADLVYDDGLEILHRLRGVAEERGSTIGAKFTNTLVVKNRPDLFPTQTDPYMYLSGQPLHVIAMTLMQRFRENLGFELPVSFSAGIDAKNFPAAVECGMVPITTCTDLLRQGGYGRLPAYLKGLTAAMRRLGVTSREAYVLAARGHGGDAAMAALGRLGGIELWNRHSEQLAATAAGDPDAFPGALRETAAVEGLDGDAVVLEATRAAGRLNGRHVVPPLVSDPRYHASRNAKTPRRLDSRLDLYDCVNCDLCIAVCPNDAIFAYEVEPDARATEVLRGPDGLDRSAGRGFSVAEAHQLAVVEDACNACSNCETFCPEVGAPFKVKERLFLAPESFAESSLDGFCRNGDELHARLGGRHLVLRPDPGRNRAELRAANGEAEKLHLELRWEPLGVTYARLAEGEEGLDTADLWRMKRVWETIFTGPEPNMLNPSPGESR